MRSLGSIDVELDQGPLKFIPADHVGSALRADSFPFLCLTGIPGQMSRSKFLGFIQH